MSDGKQALFAALLVIALLTAFGVYNVAVGIGANDVLAKGIGEIFCAAEGIVFIAFVIWLKNRPAKD